MGLFVHIRHLTSGPVILASFFAIVILSVDGLGQTMPYTNEPVTVQNYASAPLELSVIRTRAKPGTYEWSETCVLFSVRNKTKKSFDSFSYEAGPRGKRPYIFGKENAPAPQMTNTSEVCIPNRVGVDEGTFVIRLEFVETRGKASWESPEHRRAVRSLVTDMRRRNN